MGTKAKVSSGRRAVLSAAVKPAASELAALIKTYAAHDGAFATRIPGLSLTRRSRPYNTDVRDVQRPALCVVAQGSKVAMLGKEVYEYNASRMLVFAVNMPLAFQITQASSAEPYLGLRLDLEPRRIAGLVPKVFPHGLPPKQDSRALILDQMDPEIMRAATRLIGMMRQPEDMGLLAPLVVDEILIRLLRSGMGARVAQMGFPKSGVPGIGTAVSWLCENFSQPMKVNELARLANMSPSSFHQHFKAVTAMSPVQYQKVLRLQEAKRLMLAEMVDAGAASRKVGYLSASQFSREYGRLYGNPPASDISKAREQFGAAMAG